MADPFREPTTEKEAQELQRFLEQGAEVALETVLQTQAVEVEFRAPETAAVVFPDAEGLIREFSNAAEDLGLLLTLDVAHGPRVPDFALALLLNTPAAEAATPLNLPGFIGMVAFFCHAQNRRGELLCMDHGEEPARFQVPMESAVNDSVPAEVVVTLVPIPYPDREIVKQTFTVAGSVSLVRSIIERS